MWQLIWRVPVVCVAIITEFTVSGNFSAAGPWFSGRIYSPLEFPTTSGKHRRMKI
jgi:hypothetical protein